LLTPALLFAGFQQIFSTHADYDDEGYVMLSIVSYSEGAPLYDETYSQYGPFFYIAQSAFHDWTSLPVTHDTTRWKSLFVWLAAASAIMMFLFAQTSSWKLAVCGYAASFFHLERLCLEPGHPQEMCLVAIISALILATSLVRQRSRRVARTAIAALLGAVVGATLMVKLNIGVFLFVSATLLLLTLGRRGRLHQMLFWAGAIGAVALPCLVASSHLTSGTGSILPIICSLSLSSILATALGKNSSALKHQLSLDVWLAFTLGVGILVVGSCLVAIAGGTTTDGLFHGLIGQHLGFKQLFYRPAPIPLVAVVVAGVLSIGAIIGRDNPQALRPVVVGAILFGLTQFLPETLQPLRHGLVDRGAAGFLLGSIAPAMWLLMIPRSDGRRGEASAVPIERLPLCFFAVLQPMAAYPTPGTQMAVGTLLVIAGGWIVLQDYFEQAPSGKRQMEWAPAALAFLLTCLLVFRSAHLCDYRNRLASLSLSGAELMRVPPEKASRIQWLVRTLREESDTFVFGGHACNSLYFWTGQRPPTSLNPTFWPFLLRQEEQRRVIAALGDTPRAAVVHEPFGAPLPKDSALLKYLDERFQPARRRDDTEVWLPRK